MHARILVSFFTLITLLVLSTSCHKDLQGKFSKGQVALTLDDASIENWHQYLPLLDSLKIKATFYVSHYHTFNNQQKKLLKEIESRGHEIAYHTATHPDLVKEVTRNGIAQTEANEILSDLNLMKADGYRITDFAYPFGSHSSQLNSCLLRHFKSVRCLSNHQDYNKSLVKESRERQVLYGANVDNNSRLKEEGIASLMDKARDYNTCLVLVAHQINKPDISLQITRERLLFIGRAAADRNLAFVTINQIAK